MNSRTCLIILLALACVAMVVAGCTTTTTTGTPATVAASPAPAAQAAAAAPEAAATTSGCPDTYEKGIWDGSWDTRWVSEGHDIAPDPNYPGYPWSGQDSPGATPVVLSQKCRDVTGTYIPGGATMGSGTLTAKIEGNQLKGTYKTVWSSGSSNDEYGTFTLTMAADNQTWSGYAKSHDRGDYNDPDNWVGRRMADQI
jgi:hypothetical protein